MNPENPPDHAASPPPAQAVAHRHSPLALVWIVPVIAVLIALGLAVHAFMAHGPEIVLHFPVAEGLEANKTKVRYKDVEIGTVTGIALTEDRHAVAVTVAMVKDAEPLLVDDSRFWVVRPRIGAGGVSGLSTLLSGAYIALDPGSSVAARRSFTGLDTPPLVISGMAGRSFVLSTDDLGSLDIGVPVYYRRIPVGRVVGYAMRTDGKAVDVRIFIDAPYDRFVTADTRFWNASGLDVSLDAEGLKLQTQSLTSLAVGGIAFARADGDAADTVPEAAAETVFTLFADRATANRRPERVVEKYLLIFNESVRGLAVGAPVDFRGLVVGEVTRIELDYRRDTPGSANIAMAVQINLYPERFVSRWRTPSTAPGVGGNARQIADRFVAHGMRAQLRNGNLLTGQLYVALDFFPRAGEAKVNWERPIAEFPVQTGSINSLQEQLQSLMDNLNKTLQRTDKLLAGVDRSLLPKATATLGDVQKALDDARATMGSAQKTLSRADAVLASDAPMQLQLSDSLREVSRAAASVRNLADLLERHPEALINGKPKTP